MTDKARLQPVSLREFVERDVQPTRWAVRGVWAAGAKGMTIGGPKDGKSTLSIELAISLATGTPMWNRPEFPVEAPLARVTWIHQGENSESRIRKDFDAILEARGLGYMEDVYENNEDVAEPRGQRFVPTWSIAEPGLWDPDIEVLVNPGLNLHDLEYQAWFMEYAGFRDYIFLDPIYMMAPISSGDEASQTSLLTFLSRVKDETGCAVIFSHQQTNKHSEGAEAARILGTTYFHAWYETAIFTHRSKENIFSLHVDNLREMGETRDITLSGEGVGKWYYAAEAQDLQDSEGRSSPQRQGKATRRAKLKELLTEHPDWDNKQLGEVLHVNATTIWRYRQELNVAVPSSDD